MKRGQKQTAIHKSGVSMATGISANIKRASTKKTEYRLEYEGKVPEEQVFTGEAARLRCLVQPSAHSVNRLIYGDNLKVLRSLRLMPEVAGQIRLIYIDPPYATGFQFHSRDQERAYSDHLSGSVYLEFLRQRLILLHDILADDGSIYIHLDGNMAFQAKVLLDEIFGVSNFRNFITRRKTNPKNYTRKSYGNISDYILFYSKSENYVWNQQLEELSTSSLKEYRYIEEGTGRRHMRVPVHAPGVRNGMTGRVWRGMLPPPGKHWQYTPETLDQMDARGEIHWSVNGNPRRKVYLDEHGGVGVQDIWLDFKDAHNQNVRITGYPTEKNFDLIRRIIEASSNQGDLVLDGFSGSGTVAHAAIESGRNWINIDNSPLAVQATVRRLVNGIAKMGDYVTKPEQPVLLTVSGTPKPSFSIYTDDDTNLSELPESEVQQWRDWLHPI